MQSLELIDIKDNNYFSNSYDKYVFEMDRNEIAITGSEVRSLYHLSPLYDVDNYGPKSR